jgi:hypothetical protein
MALSEKYVLSTKLMMYFLKPFGSKTFPTEKQQFILARKSILYLS